MKLKKTFVVSIAALALAGGATVAYADDGPKFSNDNQVLSCDVIEVIDIPILSSANNNIDCSENSEVEETEINVTPKHHNNH
jgi:hypothetical protein